MLLVMINIDHSITSCATWNDGRNVYFPNNVDDVLSRNNCQLNFIFFYVNSLISTDVSVFIGLKGNWRHIQNSQTWHSHFRVPCSRAIGILSPHSGFRNLSSLPTLVIHILVCSTSFLILKLIWYQAFFSNFLGNEFILFQNSYWSYISFSIVFDNFFNFFH